MNGCWVVLALGCLFSCFFDSIEFGIVRRKEWICTRDAPVDNCVSTVQEKPIAIYWWLSPIPRLHAGNERSRRYSINYDGRIYLGTAIVWTLIERTQEGRFIVRSRSKIAKGKRLMNAWD